jgi:predicted AAA+ superfamily ATPase
MYHKRTVESIIQKAVNPFPAIIVTGPRPSGKTTLLQHPFSKTHTYVSLDDPDIILMANQEPVSFYESY